MGVERRRVMKCDIEPASVFPRITFRLAAVDDPIVTEESIPMRTVCDNMALYYVWIVEEDEEGVGSAKITEEFQDYLGLTEEELFTLALLNTRRCFPMKVQIFSEFMEELPEDFPVDVDEEAFNCDMYILSNDRAMYGANSILYDDVLQSVCERTNSSLFLLPSSVHEFIALPMRSEFNELELRDLVCYVNNNVLRDGEKLSDSVYVYDRERHILRKCA